MFSHNIRDGCWWDVSRDWTFPLVFHYMLLPCDRRLQWGSLREWCLTWKWGWMKGVECSMWKKWHPLTFINTSWTFMETKQLMWAPWGGEWYVATVTAATWKASHNEDRRADFYERGRQALVDQRQKCITDGGDYVEKIVLCSWKSAPSNRVIVHFVSVVVSLEINRRDYFQSDLYRFQRNLVPSDCLCHAS